MQNHLKQAATGTTSDLRHVDAHARPDTRLSACRLAVLDAMELDTMPTNRDGEVPDCTWNGEQFADLVAWVLEQGVAFGVHPVNVIPPESDWPPIDWEQHGTDN